MKPKELIISVLLFALVTTGCTSMKVIEEPDLDLDRLKEGELVTIFEHSGSVTRITIEEIIEPAIIGRKSWDSSIVVIKKSDIRAVEVERIDYALTAAAGIGSLAVVVAYVAMMSLALLATFSAG